jgi:hypothetical protein
MLFDAPDVVQPALTLTWLEQLLKNSVHRSHLVVGGAALGKTSKERLHDGALEL